MRGTEGGEKKTKRLTSRPGADLVGMAGQCPRGRPGAAEGRLHRGTTGSTTIGASTGVQPHQVFPGEASLASESETGEEWSSVVAEIPSGIQPQISSKRRRPAKLFGGG
jgi:hypothetical protein